MTSTSHKSILFDARTIAPGMTGVGRYALNLLWAISVAPGAPPVRALFRKDCIEIARRDPALKAVELIGAPYTQEEHPWADWWLERALPRMIKPGEVYHGPAFIIPGGRRAFPRVVTVHDLFVFTHARYYPRAFGMWLRWATRRACKFADRIIVPSEAVANEIEERGFASRSKIRVVAEAPDDTNTIWDKAWIGTGGLVAGLVTETAHPLIVTVGTLDPRKDPATARAAFLDLVVRMKTAPVPDVGEVVSDEMLSRSVDWFWLGGPGALPDPTPIEVRHRATEAGFHEVGHVPKEAVRVALRAATAYVTCSRSEGFGLPLVEAMVAGCPIVASDIPVHHEVAGDAALYFPEGDAEALADVLYRLMTKPALRETLVARGLERQSDFRWSKAAEMTIEAYREAAEQTKV
ncbi:glycosyltransferase family 4 protein [bacterium]|nr:glycosyltransferase family 4 protein [bacterium]